MDDSVRQALAKWPNVPSCTGWLALDRRGVWRMRDEAAQQAGALGTPIRHNALLGFINRNYAADEQGRWYFQNGPQRVFVELAYTPWVLRLQYQAGALQLTDQAGAPFEPDSGWLDDAGAVLFSDAAGRIALLHDHDLDLLTEHAVLPEDGAAGAFFWRPGRTLALMPIAARDVARQFGFIASPAAHTPAA
jgi:Protein of unknown function (DUF2946)